MKKKRTFLVVALLVAALTLAVGYSAITKNLEVTGSASATTDDSNFKVRFTGTPATSDADKVTASITSELAATIDVSGLTTTGDTVTATYTIENYSSELGAALAVGAITNNNSEYFEVTASLGAASIAAGATTTLTVTVKLVKTPIVDQTTSIKVPVTATATTI
ncbi:MAG: hypothetical protein ACI4XM_05590 [Candidatus Coprovivens sp.]